MGHFGAGASALATGAGCMWRGVWSCTLGHTIVPCFPHREAGKDNKATFNKVKAAVIEELSAAKKNLEDTAPSDT